jgi:hypothetical protein
VRNRRRNTEKTKTEENRAEEKNAEKKKKGRPPSKPFSGQQPPAAQPRSHRKSTPLPFSSSSSSSSSSLHHLHCST